MPRLLEAMKDVVSCEKLRGTAHELRSVDVRMGKPVNPAYAGGEPRELKHLSTWRKRKQ